MATTEDVVSLLRTSHAALRVHLAALRDAAEGDANKCKAQLLETIAAVRAHLKAEEVVFYPAFLVAMRESEDRTAFYAAVEEHRILDFVLSGIQQADPAAMEFPGRAKVLKDLVERHADDGEKVMFVRAQEMIPEAVLQELGTELELLRTQTAGA